MPSATHVAALASKNQRMGCARLPLPAPPMRERRWHSSRRFSGGMVVGWPHFIRGRLTARRQQQQWRSFRERSQMTRFRNVHAEKTRSGRTVYYYRPPRARRRIRLPDDYGTETFSDAVRMAALTGVPIPRAKEPSRANNQKREIGLRLSEAVKGARQRARQRGLDFDIDLDWALEQAARQDQRCVLTGIPFLAPVETRSARHPFAPSLDRIQPSKAIRRTTSG